MPYLDFHLTANEVELTKDKLKQAEQPLLTPDLALGQDKRTWNKKQLQALKLLLSNAVKYGHRDRGVFLYSRKKENVPLMFNPSRVGFRSLHFVIEALAEARLIEHIPAPPRTLGTNPKKLSEFHITPQLIRFAKSLGITKESINETKKGHVRLRDYKANQQLPHEWDDYTMHTEMLMAGYCHYLNKHNILESTEDYEEKGVKGWGDRGEPIHLYRSYRNHVANPDLQQDLEKLWIEGSPNFCMGGRSGGYWHSSKPEDRKFILIDGKKTARADYPASHVNILYTHETNNWYQTETHKELKSEGRELEDAYCVPDVDRVIGKKMLTFMLNCKGGSATSRVFNDWIYQRNDKDDDNATEEEVALHDKALKATEVKPKDFPSWLRGQLSDKHHLIKDYLMKGKVAGQIIQWVEANRMHHLAVYWQRTHGIPVLTVYDEFIVPEDEQPMVKEQMFTTSTACEVCDHYSLMDQIKNL